MSMEQNGNQNMPTAIFCRNGCGFYAAQAFDGMCSKCYKDLKQPQQNQPSMSAVQSPASSPSPGCASLVAAETDEVDSVAATLSKTSIGDMNLNTSSSSGSNDKLSDKLGAVGGSEVETASPTVATTKLSTNEKADETAEGSSIEAGESGSNDSDKGKKAKKNRCMECRKKVGLTGFVCHCGKLFCSLHRYSDTHDCTFDFKEKGQQEIRKNNPVVKGEKIQKI